VIRSDIQDDQLGMDALQFPVLDPPQDAMSGVAPDAEVGGLERGEIFVPHHLVGLTPPGLVISTNLSWQRASLV